MSFANITRLARAVVTSTSYFVDANVWIYALQGEELLNHPWQKRYTNFFYDIIDSTLNPKPRILMPTLLFSEILNTYLTKIAINGYKSENMIPSNAEFIFKKDYRPTQHYRDSYEKVCDDILGYRDSLLFIDDQSVVTDPPLYLTPAVDPFDFNDYFYYQLCKEYQKENPVTIVTNDSDFQINDVPIVTSNQTLLFL